MSNKSPFVVKASTDSPCCITDAGREYLSQIVTDTHGPVYAFKTNADPLMVAAGMARLSRRGDDMRTIILDEFANAPAEKMDALFRRVVTAYGDDSVQQLMPVSLVVEDASNLLTKKLEWGRYGAYLEQSTRYIYFDQKNERGQYRYFVPTGLPTELEKRYRRDMDGIFDRYSKIVHALTDHVRKKTIEPTNKDDRIAWVGATRAQACDAARGLLPVATTATVGIVASAQAVENMIINLSAETLPESSQTAVRILKAVRGVAPVFFERADLPERGGATAVYRRHNTEMMRKLVSELGLVEGKPVDRPEVTLVRYWPIREQDVAAEILFREGGMCLQDIIKEVELLGYNDIERIIRTYAGERFNRRHRPGRAFEFPHYEWELLIDYGIFRDLQRHRAIDMPEWQQLSVACGYAVPELVIEAGLRELYEKCFEDAEHLHHTMIAYGRDEEAQYATLLGHRMRFRFMENAREAFHIHELRTTPQGHPGYRRVVQEMHKQLAAVHPIIASLMKFVNQGEDPELTRMAAERATQAKLALLE